MGNIIDELPIMVAINFAEWIYKNGYKQSSTNFILWVKESDNIHYKTHELFQKFALSERNRLNNENIN